MSIKVTVIAEIDDGTRAERAATVHESNSGLYVYSVELAAATAIHEVAQMIGATHADKRGQIDRITSAVEVPGLPRRVHRT